VGHLRAQQGAAVRARAAARRLIQLVTLNGMAGTGKTLLAIAAGLKKVADEGATGRCS
jgi:predicted ribonuclease YlaK